MSSSVLTPAASGSRPAWCGRRIPGRLYLTEPDYWKFQAKAERPHEWKCGLGLFDESGAELGEVRPVSGYDDDGNPAMPTFEHNELLDTLLDLVRPFLGEPRRYGKLSQGMAVRVARSRGGRLRYPDVLLYPVPPRFEPHPRGMRLVLENPTVLVEILSDSTADEDLTAKLGDYASIPSVTDYLIVAQDEPAILHYTRPAGSAPEDGWHVTRHAGLEESVTLTEPAATLTLAEIYARVLSA
ncbi:Uma2 family endonuclease [Alienimonas californiensis]|uniref:Putative restriction endonuclease domain-containing protein n=1 Tax=Alienimonas californiensis TaxID=2527989 RepID=A0A517P6Z4_9PLAN|nr:Uma2 family endonuclease [Alienimonas californiensis]QDT15149.1 hypothetical protein CA12_12300 [Alienimonas californiensis]